MAIGMGTTVKQVNRLKIKLGADGIYRVYDEYKLGSIKHSICLDEFGSLNMAIDYCKTRKGTDTAKINGLGDKWREELSKKVWGSMIFPRKQFGGYIINTYLYRMNGKSCM